VRIHPPGPVSRRGWNQGDTPLSEGGGPKGPCRCKSCRRDHLRLWWNSRHASPRSWSGATRVGVQISPAAPVCSRGPIGRGIRLKPGCVLVRIQPRAPVPLWRNGNAHAF
jgi:hypothetical protein